MLCIADWPGWGRASSGYHDILTMRTVRQVVGHSPGFLTLHFKRIWTQFINSDNTRKKGNLNIYSKTRILKGALTRIHGWQNLCIKSLTNEIINSTMILWFSPIMIMMHGCQLQTMNDLELIKNQKHKSPQSLSLPKMKNWIFILYSFKSILLEHFLRKNDILIKVVLHIYFKPFNNQAIYGEKIYL